VVLDGAHVDQGVQGLGVRTRQPVARAVAGSHEFHTDERADEPLSLNESENFHRTGTGGPSIVTYMIIHMDRNISKGDGVC